MYYIYTVQTERGQHESPHYTQRLHSCLSHSPCATYTEGGQHWWGVLFSQQATFLSLALTMCTYTVQTDGGQHGGVDNHQRRTTWERALHTEATVLSLAFTMYYMQCREKTACGRALHTEATFMSLAFTMYYMQCREKTTWGRSLHTAGYIPLSRTHHVLYTRCKQREDNMRARTSHRIKLHSCLSHSPCTTYTVQTTRVGLACRQTSSIRLGHPSANRCHNWLCYTRSPKKVSWPIGNEQFLLLFVSVFVFIFGAPMAVSL